MKTIWKFTVPFEDEVIVEMPKGARVLAVQMQRSQPCLWAIVDPYNPRVRRKLHWRGTSHPVGDEVGSYVGTCQPTDRLVFHLFDEGEQDQ